MKILDGITKTLNDSTDKITIELTQLKDKLKEISPGVRTWWKNPNPQASGIELGYIRWPTQGWVIAVLFMEDGQDKPTIKPVAEAPREIKLYCYKHRADLVEQILKQTISLSRRMEKALDSEDVSIRSHDKPEIS